MSTAPTAKDLFLDCLALPESERANFLDRACGDGPLRHEVESLLGAHGRAGGFLEPRERFGPSHMWRQTPGGPTRTVGHYVLHDRIGEGGFGVVYRAEQMEPIRRQVALKVVKLGMDTAEVVRRFELERQALALMEHPNIARVFDGGVTERGRPYFVMELVPGEPITTYCDRRRLSIRDRVGLMIMVCRGVQHAHHKGIGHRDLKPTNVLVMTVDGRHEPRIIDFGIAKALHPAPGDASVTVGNGFVIGTPQYMSPEQMRAGSRSAEAGRAEGVEAGADLDARMDIFSLGVMLYELSTGQTPITPAQIAGHSMAELVQLVCEEVPAAPSVRVGRLRLEGVAEVSAARGVSAGKLMSELQGDLDWIILRAIAKRREDRYPTADAFADDLQRYLDGRPVLAGPPSWTYQARKFLRRHRAATILVVVIAGGLLACSVAFGVLLWRGQARQAALIQERDAARREATELRLRSRPAVLPTPATTDEVR